MISVYIKGYKNDNCLNQPESQIAAIPSSNSFKWPESERHLVLALEYLMWYFWLVFLALPLKFCLACLG